MMICPYNDCGWCYAPNDIENNSVNGACCGTEKCSVPRETISGGEKCAKAD